MGLLFATTAEMGALPLCVPCACHPEVSKSRACDRPRTWRAQRMSKGENVGGRLAGPRFHHHQTDMGRREGGNRVVSTEGKSFAGKIPWLDEAGRSFGRRSHRMLRSGAASSLRCASSFRLAENTGGDEPWPWRRLSSVGGLGGQPPGVPNICRCHWQYMRSMRKSMSANAN